MTQYIIGIDPGLDGGIAIYQPDHLIVHPTPTVWQTFLKNNKKQRRREMDLDAAREILIEYERDSIDCAWLEHVAARPGQGVTGVFRFGQNFGQWQGLLAALQIPTNLVRPQTWKAFYGLTRTKRTSLDLARKTWPANVEESFRLAKHDGLAEAALIAKYGHQQKS